MNYIIVGQGLAGSLLAWQLLRRDQRVLVVDRDELASSSKVAAGLLTPITGSRFTIPEGLPERLNFAHRFYWDTEEATHERFFHHHRIARIFRSQQEHTEWGKRRARDPGLYEKFCTPLTTASKLLPAPHGGFEMKLGGWMNMPLFLEVTRQHLLERTAYAIAKLNSDEVKVNDTGIRWKNIEADGIIFAEGWRGNQNRFFDWVPMNPAAGDILDISIPKLEKESRIINSGGWLIPMGDGRFRAGSTYRHDFDEVGPHDEGRAEVLAKLAAITPAEVEVIGHRSAIRPTIRRSQVFMGRHPSEPRVAFFNGLGSKGVLNGPWHADRLAEHLVSGGELPEKADILANFP